MSQVGRGRRNTDEIINQRNVVLAENQRLEGCLQAD